MAQRQELHPPLPANHRHQQQRRPSPPTTSSVSASLPFTPFMPPTNSAISTQPSIDTAATGRRASRRCGGCWQRSTTLLFLLTMVPTEAEDRLLFRCRSATAASLRPPLASLSRWKRSDSQSSTASKAPTAATRTRKRWPTPRPTRPPLSIGAPPRTATAPAAAPRASRPCGLSCPPATAPPFLSTTLRTCGPTARPLRVRRCRRRRRRTPKRAA